MTWAKTNRGESPVVYLALPVSFYMRDLGGMVITFGWGTRAPNAIVRRWCGTCPKGQRRANNGAFSSPAIVGFAPQYSVWLLISRHGGCYPNAKRAVLNDDPQNTPSNAKSNDRPVGRANAQQAVCERCQGGTLRRGNSSGPMDASKPHKPEQRISAATSDHRRCLESVVDFAKKIRGLTTPNDHHENNWKSRPGNGTSSKLVSSGAPDRERNREANSGSNYTPAVVPASVAILCANREALADSNTDGEGRRVSVRSSPSFTHGTRSTIFTLVFQSCGEGGGRRHVKGDPFDCDPGADGRCRAGWMEIYSRARRRIAEIAFRLLPTSEARRSG